MDTRAKQLIRQGEELFSKRSGLLSFWQSVAEQFYPERSDFTTIRTLGEEFANHLYDSYPLLVRRELGDFLSTLRRKDQEWFEATIQREDRLDDSGRKWLEYATQVQRRAMYDRRSQFTRAMKEADHDFVTFGQPVLTIEPNAKTNTLLYQCWHLRDCAWRYDPTGELCEVHRKWKPTIADLMALFSKKPGATLHSKITEKADKEPYTEIECRHIVISVDSYNVEKPKKGQTHVELYIDVDNQEVIFEAPLRNSKYVIPRWKTIPGTQYASSPAVTVGLPDARLIQAMSLTLLEAGEMAVRPPMAAKLDALPDGAKLFSGGITAIDAEFDGRIEDFIAPITNDARALPFAMELLKDKQQMLATAFYYNKTSLPTMDHEMTAYEFSQRLQEYIRNVIPLFEPIDSEYHAQVCDLTFSVLMDHNAFGPLEDIPQTVRGDETSFRFDNPLSQAIERQKGQKFVEAKALVDQAMAYDPACAATINWRTALRDALSGKRTPQVWLRSEDEVEQHAEELTQQQQAQRQMQMMQQGAATLEQAGKAGDALNALG